MSRRPAKRSALRNANRQTGKNNRKEFPGAERLAVRGLKQGPDCGKNGDAPVRGIAALSKKASSFASRHCPRSRAT
jgi:hypothetical protein